ncbi:succinate dehydrogenase, cytochrome b556 subunit [Prosthecochloris sp. GSB1]|uniref:succinate dehydrogenase, cytochrome b556 subunit n=1 Tax=Prosthecochloris sp. GSB1 TaxID=281093 RepID=UPI000B8CFFAC|nr:succinate dehydrogenase, cytochrome b556 subunit [Prosthecochloris sp. GSB1]ASQ91494.1 succinate dehydrogenase, cytochrome b556 subunit [Prosthecochloris sp. GSB1]
MQGNSKSSDSLKDSPSFWNFLATVFSYRLWPGMAAWLLHRLTGLFLVLYLALHIMGLRSLADPASFEIYVTTYRNPLFKVAEVLLLGTVAFHAFNGTRIMLQDLFFRSEMHKPLFYAVVGLTAAVTLAGGFPILAPYIAQLLP